MTIPRPVAHVAILAAVVAGIRLGIALYMAFAGG